MLLYFHCGLTVSARSADIFCPVRPLLLTACNNWLLMEIVDAADKCCLLCAVALACPAQRRV